MDGDKVTLECKVACDGDVNVTWLKDNKLIKSSEDFKVLLVKKNYGIVKKLF